MTSKGSIICQIHLVRRGNSEDSRHESPKCFSSVCHTVSLPWTAPSGKVWDTSKTTWEVFRVLCGLRNESCSFLKYIQSKCPRIMTPGIQKEEVSASRLPIWASKHFAAWQSLSRLCHPCCHVLQSWRWRLLIFRLRSYCCSLCPKWNCAHSCMTDSCVASSLRPLPALSAAAPSLQAELITLHLFPINLCS